MLIAISSYYWQDRNFIKKMEELNSSYVYTCENSKGECDVYISTTLTCINAVAIIINILHLLVLRKIPGLKELNYFWVLVNITLGDISLSIAVILSTNCTLRLLNNNIVAAIIATLLDCTFQFRYWLLAQVVLDRFYAVCKPFKYATSKIINNFGKLAAVGVTTNFALALAKVFSSLRSLCYSDILGPIVTEPSDVSKYLDFVTILAAVLPIVISTVLLRKIFKELKQMEQRRNMTTEDKETRAATIYVIGTCILFAVSILPTLVLMAVYLAKDDSFNPDISWLEVLTLLAHLMYGIGNVVLYGILNKAYVGSVRKICRSLYTVVKVSPQ